MRQLKTLLTILGFVLTLAAASTGSIAYGDEVHKPTPAETEALRKTITSPAYRAYESAMAACAKDAMGIDVANLEKMKKSAGIKIDPKQLAQIQDCMKDKGIEVHLENHYAGYKSGEGGVPGIDPAKAAEIEAMQARMDQLSKSAPVPVATPAQAVAPVIPTMMIAPPPTAVLPVIAAPPVETQEITAPVEAPTRKTPKKYWVTPE